MGGRHLYDEVCVRLWVECAVHCPPSRGRNGTARAWTLQTEGRFCALLVGDGVLPELAAQIQTALERGAGLEAVREALLAHLPAGGHVPLAALCALPPTGSAAETGLHAWALECDTPPLVLLRGGQPILLPVEEEDVSGHLLRTCGLCLQDGDYVAMVNETFIQPKGRGRRWGWPEIVISIRRWTDTGCDAEALARALVNTYARVAGGDPAQGCVIALRVRPLRTATVWSGPPAQPEADAQALAKLTAAEGARIICGDTTAQIAARLLGAHLELEPRPADGWAVVPPTSRLPGVDLVTEGVVTLSRAYEHIAQAAATGRLPRGEDGAARLTRLLLEADQVTFLVGRALNPVRATDAGRNLPPRHIVVQSIASALRARGKIVHVEEL